MADDYDELDTLRRADPVDQATVPNAGSPEALALLECITAGSPTNVRRTRLIAVAAAVVVLAAIGRVLLAGGGQSAVTPTTESAVDPTVTSGETPTTAGPGTTDGGVILSCIDHYSIESLRERQVIFDGTVEEVDGDTIRFAVNEWFRGGSGASTSRTGAEILGGFTSLGEPMSLDPGTRMLVAGDGDAAWACGFTQPYDAEVAAEWAEAIRG